MAGHAATILSNDSTTGATVLNAGRCTVVAAIALNTTTAAAFLHLFDASTTTGITLGTTLPKWTVASAASSVGSEHGIPSDGLMFESGVVVASTIGVAATTTAAQHVRVAVL